MKRNKFDEIVRELIKGHSNNSALSGWDWDFCNLYIVSPDEMRDALYKALPIERIDKIVWAYKYIKSKQPILEIIKIPRIKEVEIKDYQIIKRANIRFTNGLNIIVGKSATGKTTVIQYLSERYTQSRSYGERTMFEIDRAIGNDTLLIDDALNALDKKNTDRVLNDLSRSGKQIIITAYSEDIADKIKCNVINTNDFKLR